MDRRSHIDLRQEVFLTADEMGQYRWYRCYYDVYWLWRPLAVHAG